MITVFLVTLLMTDTGVRMESREFIGFGGNAGIECIAKKHQHEFTRQTPPNALGISFVCDVRLLPKGEEI